MASNHGDAGQERKRRPPRVRPDAAHWQRVAGIFRNYQQFCGDPPQGY
ncbi:hypothetical protein SM438_21060 [Salmonella enterica]|nr:hypothetical protein [Salmonella enterica]MEA1704886.1 hypothetical protein [Salmonella enterica subsp. enterica serovar Minnesota]MDX9555294.1 hypothetical protein [Salmonella enterica]MDX9564518.1 hypothetical protein [Salmonella enterica]MDX9569107.1 hypothetical protein [Salmonella enterica]